VHKVDPKMWLAMTGQPGAPKKVTPGREEERERGEGRVSRARGGDDCQPASDKPRQHPPNRFLLASGRLHEVIASVIPIWGPIVGTLQNPAAKRTTQNHLHPTALDAAASKIVGCPILCIVSSAKQRRSGSRGTSPPLHENRWRHHWPITSS